MIDANKLGTFVDEDLEKMIKEAKQKQEGTNNPYLKEYYAGQVDAYQQLAFKLNAFIIYEVSEHCEMILDSLTNKP